MMDLGLLLQKVAEWEAITFPTATAKSTRTHLWKEIEELREKPWDMIEVADVIMLSLAYIRACGYEPEKIIGAKFAELQTRTWGEPDADGVQQHIDN